ncbi:MAG: bifunctional adenosylcobinamide kinase/adenosylcobinamide-phosphate guanylyltransferase [Gomphosphaeria aponina SAG 52.96 = DSM 107014]|uniref:Adenosylcobinamide kinase n=1 Tax=Gomphosphaeria aponina SAG 52.96 = DSM 107014 TaxID=1521640 RepID=A0A941JSX0_9CHRO|nr:bifunctional adenosylcobinamide kinase/adenosylcobinamide-phosphate guanylyltransferase [Gomphosphaeria aponina SAG 52.96 = DSM 107014]
MGKANKIILVTGAARSGKSEWAETLALAGNLPVIYIATAQVDATDLEWQQRIKQHQRRRPSSWQTVIAHTELAATIEGQVPPNCLLIDSVGTWVANLLEEDGENWLMSAEKLLKSLKKTKVDVILVAEEVGWGVVPSYKTGRIFRDRLGMLVRQIGAIAQVVYLVTGGHVLNLSVLGQPLPQNQNLSGEPEN